MIDHPSEIDLESYEDVISNYLIKDSGTMPFNSNPNQFGIIGEDLELPTIPYIITNDLSSH